MANHTEESITTPADHHGSFGRAWQMDVRALLARSGREPAESDAGFGMWLVEAPRAHPVWHSYVFFVMPLRAIPDTSDPIIHLPNATHEFELWAISPDAVRQIILDTGAWSPWRLEPCNFAAQIIATDEEAKARLFNSVMEVLQGTISPDTDYVQWWAHSWGDNMLKNRKPMQ